MPYVTVAQAVSASRSSYSTRSVAESQMTKSAAAPMTTNFDIFLSHAYEDAEVIAGVKLLIEKEGLSVYVDWIEDAQADRSQVTAKTAVEGEPQSQFPATGSGDDEIGPGGQAGDCTCRLAARAAIPQAGRIAPGRQRYRAMAAKVLRESARIAVTLVVNHRHPRRTGFGMERRRRQCDARHGQGKPGRGGQQHRAPVHGGPPRNFGRGGLCSEAGRVR